MPSFASVPTRGLDERLLTWRGKLATPPTLSMRTSSAACAVVGMYRPLGPSPATVTEEAEDGPGVGGEAGDDEECTVTVGRPASEDEDDEMGILRAGCERVRAPPSAILLPVYCLTPCVTAPPSHVSSASISLVHHSILHHVLTITLYRHTAGS